jgi:hypothetical protein
MNWAGIIFFALVTFGLSAWFLWAKKHWKGVNHEIVDYVKEHADSSSEHIHAA